jgi:hypothetical protein
MSFADKIKPKLGQSVEDDEEWYVKAMHEALNNYLADIETAMLRPQFLITGITTVPGSPPYPVPITASVAQVSNKHIRLNYNEVKAAMWCGDGNLTFPNLFSLFASKLMMDFNNVFSVTIVEATTVLAFEAMSTYNNYGRLFMNEIKAIGASGAMTPEIFHDKMSLYLDTAFKSIPPVTMPLFGVGLIPTGAFTGSVTITFQTVALM